MLLFLSLLLCATGLSPDAPATEAEPAVLVLKQSYRKNSRAPHQQYVTLLEGFLDGFAADARDVRLSVVDIHDMDALDAAAAQDYRMVVCLGTYPAKVGLARFSRLPLVYAMVLNPGRHGLLDLSPDPTRGVQGGILARISPEDYLDSILRVHPGVQTIGLMYANDVFADYAQEIILEAKRRGLTVQCEVVDSNFELIPKFHTLIGSGIDLFLMLPDTEIFSKAYEFIFTEALHRGVPVMGPSTNYVKAGALWGVVLSPYEIGMQAAEMVHKGLRGGRLSIEYPRQNKLTLNHVVAEKLNFAFPQLLVERARHEGQLVE